MKLRTLCKREGRFYRLQVQLIKRMHWWYHFTRQDGSSYSQSTTDKTDARFCRVRRLYYEAYREVFGEPDDGERLRRNSMVDRFHAASARPIPPGRRCKLSQVEEAKNDRHNS